MDIETIVRNYGVLMKLHPLCTFFGFAWASSNDTTYPVLCEVNERWHKITRGYKISLSPISQYSAFESETLYQSDFNRLVAEGAIKVYIESLTIDFG